MASETPWKLETTVADDNLYNAWNMMLRVAEVSGNFATVRGDRKGLLGEEGRLLMGSPWQEGGKMKPELERS